MALHGGRTMALVNGLIREAVAILPTDYLLPENLRPLRTASGTLTNQVLQMMMGTMHAATDATEHARPRA